MDRGKSEDPKDPERPGVGTWERYPQRKSSQWQVRQRMLRNRDQLFN